MTCDEGRFDADIPDEAAMRRPLGCPHCGAGAEEMEKRRTDTEVRESHQEGCTSEYQVTWSEFRCGRCGGFTRLSVDSDIVSETRH